MNEKYVGSNLNQTVKYDTAIVVVICIEVGEFIGFYPLPAWFEMLFA